MFADPVTGAPMIVPEADEHDPVPSAPTEHTAPSAPTEHTVPTKTEDVLASAANLG